MIGNLPQSLIIGAEQYNLRSDYRDVLQVFEAFQDPELSQEEKWIVAIYLLIEPFTCADDVFEAVENGFDIGAAAEQIIWFISAGKEPGEKNELPVYDWEQDEQMIFSAINKVAGTEVRNIEYMHWWTLAGFFDEISEKSPIAFVMGIRHKKNKNKKLEKYEQEYYNSNKDSVDLKRRKSKEELEAEAHYKELWGNLV